MDKKTYFIYKTQHCLLMKKEKLGNKISILYFKVDEQKNITNAHVHHFLLSEEEYSSIQWI